VFETDENGQTRTSDEYEAALARYNAAKEAGPQDNQKTVLTDENSAGMRLYHEGGENLAKAQAGLGSAARFGADTANAIAGNLPNMALALIPGVGPAVSLGALGAQAAGGRMAELYDEDTGADEALWRGLVSGGIEVGTEVLPVGSWVEIVNRGGKGLVRNLLQQMGEEGTEEAVGYVVNYLADVAAKDPNAEFSWAELAQNAGMGAISGSAFCALSCALWAACGAYFSSAAVLPGRVSSSSRAAAPSGSATACCRRKERRRRTRCHWSGARCAGKPWKEYRRLPTRRKAIPLT